jgi:hypothetical protein
VTAAAIGEQEEVTGTKEALIAHDMAAAEDFDRLKDHCVEILDASGYRGSRLHKYMDGYYHVLREKLPPRPEPGREERAKVTLSLLEHMEWQAEQLFSVEVQARIGAHIRAIRAEFDRWRPTVQHAHLRLVVDNAPSHGGVHG